MDFQPQRHHELLAVYPDQETADRVIEELRTRFEAQDAHEGTNEDRRDALNAEMSDEMRSTFVSPQAAFIAPKEAMKTAAWMFPVCILAGIVVMLPLIFLTHGMTTPMKIVAAVLIGGGMGATCALVWMALGQKNPDEPMAAERGVTVRVPDDREDLRQVMLAAHPLRLDVVDDRGRPIQTIATEPDDTLDPKTQGKRQTHWP